MAGQYRFKDINGNIVAQISASSAGAISFSGSAVDFSNASTITLGEVQLAGTASNALLLDGFDSTAFVFTSSFNTISQSISSQLTTLQTTSGSNIGRLNNLESKSSSVDISISNINSVTASNLARLSNLESKSASVDISESNINSFTASNGNTSLNTFSASNGNTSLNSLTGSYATTGSNTFFGTQTFSGSVYIANDLIVQGSSSIQYISASSVSIGTNIVQLNTANPSIRFAGLTMIDSGSIGGSGSFLYDSLQDEFVFVHRGNGSNVTSSHFVLGPETYDSLGNETYLTCNVITKGTGKEHLVDSCIFDNGTTVCVNSNLIGTGTACFSSTIRSSDANGLGLGSISGYRRLQYDSANTRFGFLRDDNGLANIEADYVVVGTTPATSGGVRLGTQVAIRARNVANTANIPLIESTATDGVVIASGGANVGIGSSSPGSTLPIGGGTIVTNGWGFSAAVCASRKVVEINANDNNGGNVGLFLRQPNNSTGLDIWSDAYYGNTYIDSRFDNCASYLTFRFRTNCSNNIVNVMTITAAGNVGIGTCTTVEKLDIYGNNTKGAIVIRGGCSSFGQNMYLYTGGINDTGNLLGVSKCVNTFIYANNSRLTIGTGDVYNLGFSTSDTLRVSIASTGITCFACQICTPTVYSSSDSYFCGSTYGIMGLGAKVHEGTYHTMTGASTTITLPVTYGSASSIYLFGSLLGNDSMHYAHMMYYYRNDFAGFQSATLSQMSCYNVSTAGQRYTFSIVDPGGTGKSGCQIQINITCANGPSVGAGSYCTRFKIVVYNVY